MLPLLFKRNLILAFFSVLFCCSAFKAKAGLDRYEIYLNSKLILKQYVNQPLNLESLGLTDANANDRLVIHYSQCNAPNKLGKGRSIIVKDVRGNTVKQWNFNDAKNGNTGMVIPVKEILKLQNAGSVGKLSLIYTAEGHTGQLLTNLHFGTKSTTYLPKQKFFHRQLTDLPYFDLIQPLFL